MGGPNSSYTTAVIAYKFIGAHKPLHPETKCFWQGGDTIEGEGNEYIGEMLVKNLQMDKDELVRVCYDWQASNVQYDSWAKKLEKELNEIVIRAYLAEPSWESRGAEHVKKSNRHLMMLKSKMICKYNREKITNILLWDKIIVG
jgi:hypothetical protein